MVIKTKVETTESVKTWFTVEAVVISRVDRR